MHKIILAEKWTGLCNQLFALVNGILQAKRLQQGVAVVGSFAPELNSQQRIPASTVIDLEQTGDNVGIKLIDGDQRGRSNFAWYTQHSEVNFVNILRGIRFQPLLVNIAKDLCKEHLDFDKPIHTIHFRIELDAIQHWSRMNKIAPDVFREKLASRYREAIQCIPAGEQIIALTFDTNAPLLQELSANHKIIVLDTRELVNDRLGYSGRELCAVIDLLVGLECTGTFIGCHSLKLKRGSTFSYVLWRLMAKAKRGIFIDLDNLNSGLELQGEPKPIVQHARKRVLQPPTRKPLARSNIQPPRVQTNKPVLSLVKAEATIMPYTTPRELNNYVYCHICTLGPWREVVEQLFQRIVESGLIAKIEKVNVVVLGSADAVKELLPHPKVEICFNSTDNSIYERKCLSLLREHADREDCRFLYIHSKGITKTKYRGVKDWVELLTHYTIDQHQQCIEALEYYDTVGVNINTVPEKYLQFSATEKDPTKVYHYSGNFWWANSGYIKTLPTTIGPKYLDPELWIGAGAKKNMLSLWQTGLNHYTYRYPPTKYVGKTNRFIYQT